MSYKIEYTPAGPRTEEFHQSKEFITGIAGPIGSGKSVSCCMEIMRRALLQPRGNDGWARSRVMIVRNTFPELKSTTIKTFEDWFPQDVFGKIKWDAPITQLLDLGNKRTLEAVFLSVDRPEDAKKLLGFETTWVWLNEVKELSKAVLDAASSRCGRYPSARNGGSYQPGVVMDTNLMDKDHWYYKLAEEEKPEGHLFITQPSGLSPEAENLNWLNQTPESLQLPLNHPDRLALGRQYYERLVAGKNPAWVKVYVKAEYGTVSDSRPVWPEYREHLHQSRTPLAPYAGMNLYLAWDFGLTPACVVAQMNSRGQLRVLREFIGENTGLVQFIDNTVAPYISMNYPNYKLISLHDPAGVQRSQADEKTCRDILKEKGMNPSSVSTNAFMPRKEAVSYFLSRLIDGEPALLLDPSCRKLNTALAGDYKFKRIAVSGEDMYRDEPVKNMSSHIADALQYLCIHFHVPGRSAKKQPLRRPPAPTRASNYC